MHKIFENDMNIIYICLPQIGIYAYIKEEVHT
jgi:hypothetical protein